ncbi:uncharacterized mitochondrial protein-like protein [Tanacetum coccineum]
MNQFYKMKGILRQFSIARTPQQNGIAKRRNRTLIEAARTMLVDSKLPTTFWAEAINTACYVENKVLVVKPHNKTPYELFQGRTPTLSFMRPFGCLVTILNTIDHLGKFNGKADEGSGPDWLFDIDALTRTMNYEPIIAGTQSNGFAGTKASDNAGDRTIYVLAAKIYSFRDSHDGSKPSSNDGKNVDEDPRKDNEYKDQEKEDKVNSTNNVNVASTNKVNVVGAKTSIELLFDPNMPTLEDISIFDFSIGDEDDDGETDMNNLDTTIQVSPKLTIRIHKDHHLDQVIRDLQSATQIRRMSKNLEEHSAFLYAKIEEEVYVCQPPGFENPDFPDRVYKVEKALYKGDILLVQVYVDDIIFGSTKKELCKAFKKLMSSIGELTFFLGLQVQQKKDGLFMMPLLKDEDGEEVDVHMYRSMIGSLMYLTSLRPNIMFAVCACARYKVNPKVSYIYVVKRIFKHLKGQLKLGLWYPKDSPFDLVAYTDSDYAGAKL